MPRARRAPRSAAIRRRGGRVAVTPGQGRQKPPSRPRPHRRGERRTRQRPRTATRTHGSAPSPSLAIQPRRHPVTRARPHGCGRPTDALLGGIFATPDPWTTDRRTRSEKYRRHPRSAARGTDRRGAGAGLRRGPLHAPARAAGRPPDRRRHLRPRPRARAERCGGYSNIDFRRLDLEADPLPAGLGPDRLLRGPLLPRGRGGAAPGRGEAPRRPCARRALGDGACLRAGRRARPHRLRLGPSLRRRDHRPCLRRDTGADGGARTGDDAVPRRSLPARRGVAAEGRPRWRRRCRSTIPCRRRSRGRWYGAAPWRAGPCFAGARPPNACRS